MPRAYSRPRGQSVPGRAEAGNLLRRSCCWSGIGGQPDRRRRSSIRQPAARMSSMSSGAMPWAGSSASQRRAVFFEVGEDWRSKSQPGWQLGRGVEHGASLARIPALKTGPQGYHARNTGKSNWLRREWQHKDRVESAAPCQQWVSSGEKVPQRRRTGPVRPHRFCTDFIYRTVPHNAWSPTQLCTRFPSFRCP